MFINQSHFHDTEFTIFVQPYLIASWIFVRWRARYAILSSSCRASSLVKVCVELSNSLVPVKDKFYQEGLIYIVLPFTDF